MSFVLIGTALPYAIAEVLRALSKVVLCKSYIAINIQRGIHTISCTVTLAQPQDSVSDHATRGALPVCPQGHGDIEVQCRIL